MVERDLWRSSHPSSSEAAEGHVQMDFEYLQGKNLSPGSLVQNLLPLVVTFFFYIQCIFSILGILSLILSLCNPEENIVTSSLYHYTVVDISVALLLFPVFQHTNFLGISVKIH